VVAGSALLVPAGKVDGLLQRGQGLLAAVIVSMTVQ
jgi:hypothetical protein